MSHTIALVDDDRNILTSISMALENEGFKVQTYIDAESALVGISRSPPDLAVIDIKMPRMDGEELLKRLRKKTTIPILFLTSKDEEYVKKIIKEAMVSISKSEHHMFSIPLEVFKSARQLMLQYKVQLQILLD